MGLNESHGGRERLRARRLAPGPALARWAFVGALWVRTALALTTPETLSALESFKTIMEARSPSWKAALSSWNCPTVGGGCDPCGPSWWGNWDHMHCRGRNNTGKDGGVVDGFVTNIHFSDLNINGPIPRELCLLPDLRELDLDGGRLSGPIPDWLGTCFPRVAEMDLSYNRLSGEIPAFIFKLEWLQELELEYNRLSGDLPEALGKMPRLRRIELDGNFFTGELPATLSERNQTLTALLLSNNLLSGDLRAVADIPLMRATVHNNPGLCGMVPGSVRWATGYNPYATQLGKPCGSVAEPPMDASASDTAVQAVAAG